MINVCAPNDRDEKQVKQTCTELKEEIDIHNYSWRLQHSSPLSTVGRPPDRISSRI